LKKIKIETMNFHEKSRLFVSFPINFYAIQVPKTVMYFNITIYSNPDLPNSSVFEIKKQRRVYLCFNLDMKKNVSEAIKLILNARDFKLNKYRKY